MIATAHRCCRSARSALPFALVALLVRVLAVGHLAEAQPRRLLGPTAAVDSARRAAPGTAFRTVSSRPSAAARRALVRGVPVRRPAMSLVRRPDLRRGTAGHAWLSPTRYVRIAPAAGVPHAGAALGPAGAPTRELPAVAQTERPTSLGTAVTLHDVPMPALASTRSVTVYVPRTEPGERLPVVYFQDGQNYDAWRVEEAAQRLQAAYGLRFIVVAVPHGAARLDEYAWTRDAGENAGGRGDAYLDDLVNAIKPLVDARFPTLRDASHTALVGSSMGGLSALRAAVLYPHVFRRVAAMSPSLWWNRRAMLAEFARYAPADLERLYIDAGTNEAPARRGADGRDYVLNDARALARRALALGYSPRTRLGYREAIGRGHNEADWADRLSSVLDFLLADAPRRVANGELRLLRDALRPGEQTAAALELVYEQGRRLSAPPGTFRVASSDPGVARVVGDRIVAVAPGTATLRVTHDGVTATTTLRVDPAAH